MTAEPKRARITTDGSTVTVVYRYWTEDSDDWLDSDATTLAEAMAEAHDAAGEGWDTQDSTHWVDYIVEEIDEYGDVACEHDGTRAIDPEEPECADGRVDHDWQEQSCQGQGGGVVTDNICAVCGAGRHMDSDAQREDTGEQGLDSVSYDPPDTHDTPRCRLREAAVEIDINYKHTDEETTAAAYLLLAVRYMLSDSGDDCDDGDDGDDGDDDDDCDDCDEPDLEDLGDVIGDAVANDIYRVENFTRAVLANVWGVDRENNAPLARRAFELVGTVSPERKRITSAVLEAM